MRNPFRRWAKAAGGRGGLLHLRYRSSGAYTVETPDIGTGHYLFDPGADCEIHSRRLEPWCDIDAEDTAREELHWHSLMLSELGTAPEDVRSTGGQMIAGRRDRRVAERRGEHELKMSKLEGSIETLPGRLTAAEEAAEQTTRREKDLREQAERARDERRAEQVRHDNLPPRAWLSVTLRLTVSVSIGFFVFDLGLVGAAFELLSGGIQWKIPLAIGVSLAPLSTAIGIAAWLSAAEHPVRKGKAAGRLALVAGGVAIVGLLLVTFFRAAVLNEEIVGWPEFSFLSFMQIGLAMAETMLYTVYFDGKVGEALRRGIKELTERIEQLEQEADRQADRRQRATQLAKELERETAGERALLRREDALLSELSHAEDGAADVLRSVVDSAILEGEVARKRRELRDDEKQIQHEPWLAGGVAYAALAIAVLALTLNGVLHI